MFNSFSTEYSAIVLDKFTAVCILLFAETTGTLTAENICNETTEFSGKADLTNQSPMITDYVNSA